MLGWEYPPHNSGGLGVACAGLTKSLVGQGVDVTFMLPYEFPVDDGHMKFIFAQSAQAAAELHRKYGSGYHNLLAKLKLGNENMEYVSELLAQVQDYAEHAVKIAKELEFDIIHAHDWLTFPAGLAVQQSSHKPLVTHVHATEFDRTGRIGTHPVIAKIEHGATSRAERVVAVSNYTKRVIQNQYGIDSRKINVVHNGTMPSEHVQTDNLLSGIQQLKQHGKKVVLFVGRLTMQKGPDYLLRAAKIVSGFDPNVIFIMAGSGDMERQLIELGAELGISDKILFPGFLRGSELAAVYKLADVFVMPSVSEPFGLVGLEAAHYNLPTILSKQSGVSEVLSHSFHADFWDTDLLAEYILGLLQHRSMRLTMSGNARHQARSQSWDKAAKSLVNIYQNLLAF